MALRITDVKLRPSYDWDDVKQLASWDAVKGTNQSWQTLTQTSVTGQLISIEVEVIETTWEYVMGKFASWDDIKNSFTDWSGLKNI